MTGLRASLEVARWEFRRLFKLKDLMVSLLVSVLLALAYVGAQKLLYGGSSAKAKIAVIHSEQLPFEIASKHLEWTPAPPDQEAALRQAVARKKLDGLLIIRNTDEGELLVIKEPRWRQELEAALSAARSKARLSTANLSPHDLAAIVAPFHVDVRYHESAGTPFDFPKIATVAIILGLMLMGIVMGSTYLFMGITGEKQLRVTEQIVSAIPPQAWIDGKILGHAAMTFVSMLNLALAILLSNFVLNLFGRGIEIPLFVVQPLLLVSLAVFSILGFFFWFSFYAAVAATVDDPNLSNRGMVLFLPFGPLSLGFLTLVRGTDDWISTALAVFPLTSPSVMPVRIIVADVAAWEVPLAVALLGGSIWLMRRAAGKIFALGILMYGKEPTWGEIWRWLKEA